MVELVEDSVHQEETRGLAHTMHQVGVMVLPMLVAPVVLVVVEEEMQVKVLEI